MCELLSLEKGPAWGCVGGVELVVHVDGVAVGVMHRSLAGG